MIKKEFKFKNGDAVIEKVTGFKGTITGSVYYLTGCNQYLVTPICEKSHKKPDGFWFDEERLVLVKEGVVDEKEVTGKNNGPDTPAPGGKRDY